MKYLNVIILLIICGGGWYYYDTNYRAKGDTQAQREKDAADDELWIKNLKEKAVKLFPTKENDRQVWLDNQINARFRIKSACKELAPNVAQSILKHCEKTFPDDYDKQLILFNKQKLAANSLMLSLKNLNQSDDDFAKTLAFLSEGFEGDYITQEANFAKIADAYKVILSMRDTVSPKDFEILYARAMKEIFVSAEKALKTFQEQARARYNYLTMSISPQLGNLRAGIEEEFPTDFVAQLNALNARVDAALNARGLRSVVNDVSVDKKQFVRQYMIPANIYGAFSGAFFVNLKGEDYVVFSSAALKNMPYDRITLKSFGLTGEEVVTVSDKSMLSFVKITKSNGKYDALTPQKVEMSGSRKVYIVGFDSSMNLLMRECTMLNGTIEQTIDLKTDLQKFGGDIILVIDVETNGLLGLCEKSSDGGFERYGISSDFNMGKFHEMEYALVKTSMIESAKDFKKIFTPYFSAIENPEYKVLLFENILTGQQFYSSKFKAEEKAVKSLCDIAYSIRLFMTDNEYDVALKIPLFRKSAESFRKEFLEAGRTAKKTFLGNYSKYLNAMLSISRRAVPEDFEKNVNGFYYPNRIAGIVQFGVAQACIDELFSACKMSFQDFAIHTDLAENIQKDIYMARKLKDKDEGGKNGENDSMGTLKFRVRSKE